MSREQDSYESFRAYYWQEDRRISANYAIKLSAYSYHRLSRSKYRYLRLRQQILLLKLRQRYGFAVIEPLNPVTTELFE